MGLQVGTGGVEGRGAQRVDQVDVSAGAQKLGDDGLVVGIGCMRGLTWKGGVSKYDSCHFYT